MEKVALFTGAWIETILVKQIDKATNESHSSRVRGLKQRLLYILQPLL